MKKTFLNNPVKALALAFGLFSSAVFAADAPLKIGTTAAFAIPLEAAVEEAGKQGLKVELVEFTDWIAPNVSLAAGDIDVLAGPVRIGEAVTAGEAAWLNVWSAQRLRRWPDVPTLRELGYRLVVTTPFGIVGPPGLPAEIRDTIREAALATMRTEDFRTLLERLDMTEDYRDSAAYGAFLAESARMEEMLIGRLGLQP